MNSSDLAGDWTMPSQYHEVDISVVADFVGASETGDQIPNQSSGLPAEVFTTTASNFLEWSMP